MRTNPKMQPSQFVQRVIFIVIAVVALTWLICWLAGWQDETSLAFALLISGSLTTVVGAVLASEPLRGRAGTRRGLEETDKARYDERRQDRTQDKTLFDLLGTAGVLVMGIGVLVYLVMR